MRPRKAGHSAHTYAFSEKRYNLDGLAEFDGVPPKRFPARLRESGPAAIAPVSLGSEFPVGSKPLCGSVLAPDAGHRTLPLAFLRGKPDTGVGFECGLRSRLNLASPSVQAGGGAFC